MKSPALTALLLILASGCAVQTLEGPPPDPTPDAAAPTLDAPATVPVADGRTVDGGAEVSAPLDASDVLRGDADAMAPPSSDAGPQGPDALPPTVDSGPDAAPGIDALVSGDADATPPPVVDAGRDTADGAPVADVAPGDGGNVDPVCTSPAPSCVNANAADQAIRQQFVKPCAATDRKCGGVRGAVVVETLPMVCRAGQWRLAGYWSGVQWVAGYSCSTGCAAGQLCDP